MKVRISSIFAFLFGTLLLGVLLCCCMFYDNNTGTINPTQNKVYTQDEYNSNYENGYASGTDKLAELTAQINTLTASLDAKIELIAEYENNHNIDATTINDLRAEITRLNNTIAILQADIDRYIEQLNNPTNTTVTATFYLTETDTDIYYTKILNAGDTLSISDIPVPEDTTTHRFIGWCVSGSDVILTSSTLTADTIYFGKWETIAITSCDFHIASTINGEQQDGFTDADDFVLNNFENITSLTLNGEMQARFSYSYTEDGFNYSTTGNFEIVFDNTELKYDYGSSTIKYYSTQNTVTFVKTDDETITKSVKLTIILSPKETHEVEVIVWYSENDNEYHGIDYIAPYDYVLTINI